MCSLHVVRVRPLKYSWQISVINVVLIVITIYSIDTRYCNIERHMVLHNMTVWILTGMTSVVKVYGFQEGIKARRKESAWRNTPHNSRWRYFSEIPWLYHIITFITFNNVCRFVITMNDRGGVVHIDVIRWGHLPRYWPFVRDIHRSPVDTPHKGQWRGTLMFSIICDWAKVWANNRNASHL